MPTTFLPGPWWDHAACRGMPLELFFGPPGAEDRERLRDRYAREAEAVGVCARCPVRLQCLAVELRHSLSAQNGVVGGTTADERRDILAARDLRG